MRSTLLKIIIAGLSIGSTSGAFATAPQDVQLSELGRFVATSPIGTHKNLDLIRPFIASKNGGHANAVVSIAAVRDVKQCRYQGTIAYEPTENQEKIINAITGAKLSSLHRPFSGSSACGQLAMSLTGLVTYELEAITHEYLYGQKIARGSEQERLISARMGEPFNFGNGTLDKSEISTVALTTQVTPPIKRVYKPIQVAASTSAPKMIRAAASTTPPRFYQSSGVKLLATPQTGRVVVRSGASTNSHIIAAISGSTDIALETCGRNGWLKWNNLGYVRVSDIKLVAPAVEQI